MRSQGEISTTGAFAYILRQNSGSVEVVYLNKMSNLETYGRPKMKENFSFIQIYQLIYVTANKGDCRNHRKTN